MSAPTPGVPTSIAPLSATAGRATLPNLSAIIDSKSATLREVQVATGQRIAREFKAYGHLSALANASGDPRAYLKAYITYYDSLSAAEQQTARYRGTREGALKGLAENPAPAPPTAEAPSISIARGGSDDGASILPNAEFLSGLRSLLGVIQKTRHPGPIERRSIPQIDYKA